MTSPGSGRETTGIDPAQMRRVLGAFCSGLVVVTAHSRGERLGFTCQSFASLSLDPPLVMFAPARTSTTWPRIRDADRFCVNVLAYEHLEVSNQFAVSGPDKFRDVRWHPSPGGAPILDGSSAWLDCSLWGEYDGGDHTIVVGEVHALSTDPDAHPLLFYRGTYTRCSETS